MLWQISISQPHAFCNERPSRTKRRPSASVPLPSTCPRNPALNQHTYVRTGVHTVADVFCVGCSDRLGWFYHKAADFSQKYKEGIVALYYACDGFFWAWLVGKYLLEKERLVKENAWELDDWRKLLKSAMYLRCYALCSSNFTPDLPWARPICDGLPTSVVRMHMNMNWDNYTDDTFSAFALANDSSSASDPLFRHIFLKIPSSFCNRFQGVSNSTIYGKNQFT